VVGESYGGQGQQPDKTANLRKSAVFSAEICEKEKHSWLYRVNFFEDVSIK
jgi:hypothetical protein